MQQGTGGNHAIHSNASAFLHRIEPVALQDLRS
jgi:hypothetical protein